MNTSTSSAVTRIPICDLGLEYESIKAELDPVLHQILASGAYVLGAEAERFEAEVAAYCQSPYALGVNSGTDAILIALRALDIGPGDDVILPAMTFFATAEPVTLLGARPVFVDIDPNTYTIDPAQISSHITSRTQAIIAVHLYGLACDMDKILPLADSAKLPVIEDMAQAIGSAVNDRRVGSLGTMACLSFFPTKNLGACGDAGAVLTASESLAQRVRKLRNHGAAVKYQHEEIGYNSRLDELQAAVLRVKLRHLDAWNARRREIAKMYSGRLAGLPLVLPQDAPGRHHIYHLYSVRCDQRDALRAHLENQGIATGLHYPAPLHLQTAYKGLGHKQGEFPYSEQLARETLSLPLYPQLQDEAVERVINAVRSFF